MVKKVVLIIFVGLAVTLGVYLFLPKREDQTKRENQTVRESQVQVVETENYPLGAITEAKVLSEKKPFRDEADQLFGLRLWSDQKDTYLQFKKRLLANSQLTSVLRNAKKENVSVFLANEFWVGAGYVDINVSAIDGEIVKFLNESVAVAKAKTVSLHNLRQEASQYGLYIRDSDREKYRQIKGRLSSNKNLASALQAAARAKVTIFLSNRFSVGQKWVEIDVSATDEKIIKFLLGE